MSLYYDLASGNTLMGYAEQFGYTHRARASWPCRVDAPADGAYASECRAGDTEVLHDFGGSAAYVTVEDGEARGLGLGPDAAIAREALARLRELYPVTDDHEADQVPVRFWSYGPHGPQSVRRDLDAPAWAEVADNYPGTASTELERLVGAGFTPGSGGQLILWSGEPGTGKTTALRMLAREWRSWCDLHYIADPDKFFGAHADYMLGVMLQENYDDDDKTRWRVLVLEDSGELLQRDAKREVGQALSRFLNAVDGLIGRGLRVLVLVTTNEDVGSLHPAVARPGRCAAEIEFPRFDAAEARDWLDAHDLPADSGSATLAELYAVAEGFAGARTKQPVGFAT